MSQIRAQIAQLVGHLDHPDAVHQRGFMDQLIALYRQQPEEALDGMLANLKLAEPRARVALVRVLSELAPQGALVPLMRFVFDSRDAIGESDARGLAMQTIMKISGPEHARRLFDFLLDVRQDADPFVRGYAVEALSRFGDPRAEPLIRAMREDESLFVRERVQRALEQLQGLQGSSDELAQRQMSGEELLGRIRGSQGEDRVYWMGILQQREDAFELLAELVTQGGSKGVLIGLRGLLESADPRARQLAVRHYATARDEPAERAICLRLLGNHLSGDATPEEVKLIASALHDGDMFVRRAALYAAGGTGDATLTTRVIESVQGRDYETMLDAAKGLGRSSGAALKRFMPQLLDALGHVRGVRQSSGSNEPELIEANLLQALSELAPHLTVGRGDLQREALRSLHGARHRWPIVVSALKLLRETRGEEEMLPIGERWGSEQAATLLDLLEHEDERVRERALDFLYYGVAPGWGPMVPYLERLLHNDEAPIATRIVPLLERAGSPRAQQLLEDLTRAPSEEVSEAARAALRHMREEQPVLEARFTRPPE